MRIEKGHSAGNELNGMTTAADLGLTRMVSKNKDFIGRVMAQRPALTDPDRPQLAGFRPVQPQDQFAAGAHVFSKTHRTALNMMKAISPPWPSRLMRFTDWSWLDP